VGRADVGVHHLLERLAIDVLRECDMQGGAGLLRVTIVGPLPTVAPSVFGRSLWWHGPSAPMT
jgi:hypothetical protein